MAIKGYVRSLLKKTFLWSFPLRNKPDKVSRLGNIET